MQSAAPLPKPKLLIVRRHAESLRNRVKNKNVYLPDDESAAILKGIPDHRIPITDLGKQQAERIGEYVREKYGIMDCYYDSGYKRTIMTREFSLGCVSKKELRHSKIRSHNFLAERFPGYTYDMTTEQAQEAFPYLQAHFDLFGTFYGVPPGGESQAWVTQRVHAFLGMMFRHRVGQKVLLDTHGGTMRAIRYILEGWDVGKYESTYHIEAPPNCAILVYKLSKKTGQLKLKKGPFVPWGDELISH